MRLLFSLIVLLSFGNDTVATALQRTTAPAIRKSPIFRQIYTSPGRLRHFDMQQNFSFLPVPTDTNPAGGHAVFRLNLIHLRHKTGRNVHAVHILTGGLGTDAAGITVEPGGYIAPEMVLP